MPKVGFFKVGYPGVRSKFVMKLTVSDIDAGGLACSLLLQAVREASR